MLYLDIAKYGWHCHNFPNNIFFLKRFFQAPVALAVVHNDQAGGGLGGQRRRRLLRLPPLLDVDLRLPRHRSVQLEDDQGHGRGHARPLRPLRHRHARVQLPVVPVPDLRHSAAEEEEKCQFESKLFLKQKRDGYTLIFCYCSLHL